MSNVDVDEVGPDQLAVGDAVALADEPPDMWDGDANGGDTTHWAKRVRYKGP